MWDMEGNAVFWPGWPLLKAAGQGLPVRSLILEPSSRSLGYITIEEVKQALLKMFF